ncbi:FliO/MopB family protein [bacterium]|nr:FliO/MopB family protein [bacterium]
MGYLMNFIVYTAAMTGIIFLAVFVYKKFSITGNSMSQFLNVEESISLAPRKQLYVVRAGRERFLIASDINSTSLISKLDDNYRTKDVLQSKGSVDELPSIVNIQSRTGSKRVFKNIINNI